MIQKIKLKQILECRKDFQGINKGIQIMEKFSEYVENYRNPNGLISYYDVKSNDIIKLNLDFSEIQKYIVASHKYYRFDKYMQNRWYKSMFDFFKEEIALSDLLTHLMLEVILNCFFILASNDRCDKSKFISNLKEGFDTLFKSVEKSIRDDFATEIYKYLINQGFFFEQSKIFKNNIIILNEPLFILDYKINSIMPPKLEGSNIKYSSEYLVENINEVTLNFFARIDKSVYDLLMSMYMYSKEKQVILMDFFKNNNDYDLIRLYEQLELDPNKTENATILTYLNYIYVQKSVFNDYLLNCVIVGCFDYYYHYYNINYNILYTHSFKWKIPLSQIELDV